MHGEVKAAEIAAAAGAQPWAFLHRLRWASVSVVTMRRFRANVSVSSPVAHAPGPCGDLLVGPRPPRGPTACPGRNPLGRGIAVRHDGRVGVDTHGLGWSRSVEPAAWIEPRLLEAGSGVAGSVIPTGFPAYARLLHPVHDRMDDCVADRVDDRPPVRWGRVAGWSGIPLDRLAQFHELALPERAPTGRPPWDGHGPVEGTLDTADTRALIEVLARHTATVDGPRRCWFCFWEGYGWNIGGYLIAVDAPPEVRVNPPRPPDPIPDQVRSGAARVRLPWRDYFLYTGDLTDATTFLPDKGQTPNLWWAEDRSWCVASEIDLPWTYLAGPASLIDQVLHHPDLEALPAHPDDPCTLRVPAWLQTRLDVAVDELIATHTAVVDTSRGVARATLRPPSKLRDGLVRIELHRAETPPGSAGSSEALLSSGRPDPGRLRDTVSFYLLHAILSMVCN